MTQDLLTKKFENEKYIEEVLMSLLRKIFSRY